MIKKISAILLALVLCLSVVVVPASALELAKGSDIAFELKWDKNSYNAGDTATLSIYMKATSTMELGTGAITIGFNSAVISKSDNQDSYIKSNAVSSDLWNSFWKNSQDLPVAWQKDTIVSRIEQKNTTKENSLYDEYLKILLSRDISGSHKNAQSVKNGLPGEEINALNEPIIKLSFKVRKDIANGTKIDAAITSGTFASSPAQTTLKYYTNPGKASTTANVSPSAFGIAVRGALVTHFKEQVKVDKTANGKYAGTFDYKVSAMISADDLKTTFTNTSNAKEMIKEIGFIMAKSQRGNSINMSAVKVVATGKSKTYTKVPATYLSTGFGSDKYVISCTINNIPDSAKNYTLSFVAYIAYTDSNGVTLYDFYPNVQIVEISRLYNSYVK